MQRDYEFKAPRFPQAVPRWMWLNTILGAACLLFALVLACDLMGRV